MSRIVNIFPSRPISENGINITSPTFDASLSEEEIMICLKKRAQVFQVFPDSNLEPVQITIANIKDDLEAQAKAKEEAELAQQNALATLAKVRETTYNKLVSTNIITDFTGLYITDANNQVVSISEVASLSHYAPDITTNFANNVFTLSGSTSTPLRNIKILIEVDKEATGASIVTVAAKKYLLADVDLSAKLVTINTAIANVNNIVLGNVLLVVFNDITVPTPTV